MDDLQQRVWARGGISKTFAGLSRERISRNKQLSKVSSIMSQTRQEGPAVTVPTMVNYGPESWSTVFQTAKVTCAVQWFSVPNVYYNHLRSDIYKI